ncbi:hypothetical protein CFter6_1001 [Collimonas fungivorans]|uniref:Uncharacterized protein n=1 Tax=Collimonas fungivorans TaxID=158899 RepID=A0A127P7C8_9BURK|nr:hypothetical protein CFter6_1001 [Collimonas fungivorans]
MMGFAPRGGECKSHFVALPSKMVTVSFSNVRISPWKKNP